MRHRTERISRIKRAVAIFAAAAVLVSIGGCSLFRKTIFYVNSHHAGHGPSDRVMAGMREVLRSSNVHLRVFMMDTARYPDEGLIGQRVEKSLFEVREYEPDVIIASDDNAVKYFIAPNFAKGPTACVFCGVDWRCDQYGLPTKYVTGMLEVPAIGEAVSTLTKYYPKSKTVFVLSGKTASERKSIGALKPVWERLGLTPIYALVVTYDQWMEQFIEANTAADIVYLPASGAIKGWDDEDAKRFVREHIRVPVFTCDYQMMPYAVFGLTKVPEEQGRWAAKTALQILAGKKPRDIPVTQNKEAKACLNVSLAAKIGFEPDEELLGECLTIQ